MKKHAQKQSEFIERLMQLCNNNIKDVERIKKLFDACFDKYWKTITIEDLNQFKDEDDAFKSSGFGFDLENIGEENDTCYDLYYELYDKIKNSSYEFKIKTLNVLGWYYLKDKIEK